MRAQFGCGYFALCPSVVELNCHDLESLDEIRPCQGPDPGSEH